MNYNLHVGGSAYGAGVYLTRDSSRVTVTRPSPAGGYLGYFDGDERQVGEWDARGFCLTVDGFTPRTNDSEALRDFDLCPWEDGEPCFHPACLHHVKSPCEGCGRKGGRRDG